MTKRFLGTYLVVCWSLVACAAYAQEGRSCSSPAATSVNLLILANPQKVNTYAATLKNVGVLRRDATTVVLDDGRVITSDVTATSEHLNALGWGHLPIKVVASFSSAPRRRAKG